MKTMKIEKVKYTETKPMSEEEAILQMELMRKDFLMFRNANMDEMCLLYKEKDGRYGMIIGESL